MSRKVYNKPALLYKQQLQQLKDRGLQVESDKKAVYLLERISYYRLSGYWYPLLEDKENHIFKRGATFQAAFLLYRFDRELRMIVLRELEKIEVAIRSQMIYVLSHAYSPFWFRDNTIFRANKINIDETLERLRKDTESKEKFILSFKEKYSNSYPPSWMLLELITFGSLSTLYMGLQAGTPKRDVAHFFGLDDKTFSSWLHSLVYLRNVCAHHSRLWNKDLNIVPKTPQHPKGVWLQNQNVRKDRFYFAASMLLYLLQTVNSKHHLVHSLKVLFKRYPSVDPAAMGFPKDWESEPLWQYRPSLRQRASLMVALKEQ